MVQSVEKEREIEKNRMKIQSEVESKLVRDSLFGNLIDRKQLAEELAVSESFVSKLMALHGLPYIKLGRAVRYDLREVMAFLNERKFPSAGGRCLAELSTLPR